VARVEVIPGGLGLNEFRERFGKPLKVLMAIALLVLLIACANIANLLLARAAARQKEVAVRLAIGASRLRLVRQFLTESLLLAFFGSALGLILASWATRLLLLLASEGKTPVPLDVRLNLRTLGFTLLVSVVTALLFGLAPAFLVTKQNLHSSLKLTTVSHRRQLLSRPLVVAQIALSLLLLTGAGLFVQTLKNLRSIDLGFNPEQILQVRFDPSASGYRSEQLPDLYRRLTERLNAAPGIRSASLSTTGFRSGSSRTCCISVEGYTHQPNEDREIQIFNVSPDYFKTLGIPILSGRTFSTTEVSDMPVALGNIAIINQAFARRYFGDASPLGRRFGWGNPPESATYDIQIVGMVKDANYGNLRDRPKPLIYFPISGGSLITVSATNTAGTAIQTLRQEIKAVDPSLEISSVRTISELLDQALVKERLLARLSSAFSVIAVVLACIGLYGLMSHSVSVRTREIGIRIALGAQQLRVLRMVLSETMRVVMAGLLLGIVGAFFSSRLISSLLFGLRPNDPTTLIASTVLLFIVAGVSGWVPARRATKVDPIVALREE
jgi:predicted permease